MRERGWGRIVAIASTTVREPIAALILSNAERSAQLAAYKTLAREVARDGVTINSLLTGSIATERLASLAGSMENAEAGAATTVPAGRHRPPEEMAWAAAFLRLGSRGLHHRRGARRRRRRAARHLTPRRLSRRGRRPRMRGVTGYRRAFSGNGKPRQRSKTKPARSISASVSRSAWQPPNMPGPQRVDAALPASEARPAGAHVLVEAQLAAGAQDAAKLGERRRLVGHRAQHAAGDHRVDRAGLELERVGDARRRRGPGRARRPARLLGLAAQVRLGLDGDHLGDGRPDSAGS